MWKILFPKVKTMPNKKNPTTKIFVTFQIPPKSNILDGFVHLTQILPFGEKQYIRITPNDVFQISGASNGTDILFYNGVQIRVLEGYDCVLKSFKWPREGGDGNGQAE